MTRSNSSLVVLFVLTVTFSLISASIMATLFLMPMMQMSFAKKSGTAKDSGDSKGSSGDSGGSGSSDDGKARVSHDPANGTPACGSLH
jgi:uncharacterized membrane protein YgcG